MIRWRQGNTIVGHVVLGAAALLGVLAVVATVGRFWDLGHHHPSAVGPVAVDRMECAAPGVARRPVGGGSAGQQPQGSSLSAIRLASQLWLCAGPALVVVAAEAARTATTGSGSNAGIAPRPRR